MRVGLICNTGFTPGTALRRYLTQHGLHDHFAAMHFSCETGFAKPHRRAFTDTLKALGVTPAETIHIGDNPATDVAGAKRVGMRAALLHRAATPPPPGHGADVVVATLGEFAAYLGH